MAGEIFNEKLYCIGRAVIDRSFHTQSADETFFRYFGNDVTYSIRRTIDDSDFPRIEECLRDAENEGDSGTVIRMKGTSGMLRWVLASVRLIEGKGDEPLFSISFSDIMSLEAQGYIRQKKLSDYRSYLGLGSDLAFEYSFTTKHIKIYMFDLCREIMLADEDIEVWQKDSIEKGYVLSRYIDTFNSFCRDIRNGVYRFDYEFETSLLTEGRTKEMYLFRGMTRYEAPYSRNVLGIISAVSSQHRVKDVNLALEAKRDSLSGLLNKRAVTSYAHDIIAAKPACNVRLILLYIDDFSGLNSSMGHLFGDEVIYRVAQIIKKEICDHGLAGRISGEGYLMILEDIRSEEELRGILRSIRSNIEFAFSDRGYERTITCSMGISGYPDDSDDYEELFMQAEKALTVAQEKGQNHYVIYDIEKHGAVAKDAGSRPAFLSSRGERSEKLDFIGRLAENLVLGRVPDLSVLIEQIRSNFAIDDICVFAGSDMGLILSCGNAPSRDSSYLLENNYTERFTGDGLFVINDVNELEGRDDNAFAELMKQNVGSAVQFLITENSMVKGMISFCYLGRSKKWSASDINYFAVIGRIITALLKKQAYI
ncbi:MAG: GGDEF domain-containing protein [Ruminococcus sp.]|nr:GGDEF domain-containing protein [Ruminococcus sp.]